MVCRSFSELYQKAIKDAECKPGEDQSGEAWVLDEREEEEEEEREEEVKEEDKLKGGGSDEVDIIEVGTTEVEGHLNNKEQSERGHTTLLTPPCLPLLRATSLQDQPANQSEESSSPQLTRSCSLERTSYRDTCDG